MQIIDEEKRVEQKQLYKDFRANVFFFFDAGNGDKIIIPFCCDIPKIHM